MKPVVVDASVSGAWVLPDESSQAAERLLEKIVAGELELSVPDLWSYELTNLLLAAFRRRRIDEETVWEAHRLIGEIPVRAFDQDSVLARRRTTRLALRFDLSAYDAAYLELADRLQCPLRSFDRRLSQAARSIGLVDD